VKFQIKNRFSGAVQFECELGAEFEAFVYAIQLGAAVKIAIKARANLFGANLFRANLFGANLSRADGQKLTVVGNRPTFWLGPIGRDQRTITAWRTDAGVYVRAGCFWDTLDKFKAAIAETHGDNEHGREYSAAVVMIEAHFEVWE
jgi:hypothetical protein